MQWNDPDRHGTQYTDEPDRHNVDRDSFRGAKPDQPAYRYNCATCDCHTGAAALKHSIHPNGADLPDRDR